MQIVILFISILLGLEKPDIGSAKLTRLNGTPYRITSGGGQPTVIYFLSPECPLCQSYSLNIKKYAEDYQAKGIRFMAIIPGTTFSSAKVSVFRIKYKLQQLSFYFDPNLELVRLLDASVTPEVFVFDKNDRLIYSGRIDNWAYDIGKKRKVITEHDLEKVLTSISQNTIITYRKTKAIGCFIE